MKSLKRIIAGITIVVCNLIVVSETAAQAVFSDALSPAIEWKDNFNLPEDMFDNNINPAFPGLYDDLVDDEWYFDITEIEVGGVVQGYAAVGYGGDRNFRQMVFENQAGITTDCFNSFDPVSSALADYSQEDFETSTRQRGFHRQLLVFYNLDGSVSNYFRYNQGDLFGIVQDGNHLYLIGEGQNARTLTDGILPPGLNWDEPQLNNVPIYYNPTSQNQVEFNTDNGLPSNFCTANPGVQWTGKLNILKVNLQGQVIWNNYYGFQDNIVDAVGMRGIGKSLAIQGNNIVAGGFATKTISGSDSRQKYLVSLDKNTGYMNWKTDFQPQHGGEIFQIDRVGNNWVLSGKASPSGLPDDAFIGYVISSGANQVPFDAPVFYKISGEPMLDAAISSAVFGGLPTRLVDRPSMSTSARISGGKLFWCVMRNNLTGGFFSGFNRVQNAVLVEMTATGSVNAAYDLGEMRAYDMWMSCTPTSDGGVAVVTTRHSPAFFGTSTLPTPNTPLDLNNPSGPVIQDCTTGPNDITWGGSTWYQYISTCSYVAKFDSNLNLEWDKIWDSADNAPRECFPGNLKQQECVYRIIESSVDGGLMICGNTSDNFDDGYIVKLYNDCAIQDFVGLTLDGNGIPVNTDFIADFNDGVYEITTNTTWNTPKKVLGEVYIEPGVTLTIDNTTIQLAQNSNIRTRIDVDLDGELIVTDGILKGINGCDGSWEGLFAWSNKNNHQYEQYGTSGYRDQGYIRLTDSFVSGAIVALNNSRRPETGENGGGVLLATRTTFINNKRDAQFMKYQNFSQVNPSVLRNDLSYFTLCEFRLNNGYTGDTPDSRITMWDVEGVDFNGCTFVNNQSVSQSSQRERGIYSSKARFEVRGYCDGPVDAITGECFGTFTRSSFDGFYRAIEESPTAPNTPFYVEDAIFDNNLLGIKAPNTVDIVVERNTFNVGDHTLPPDILDEFYEIHSGIVVEESQNFTVELNDFNGSNSQTTYGAVAANTGGVNNDIRSNDYNQLSFGNYAFGVNRFNGIGFIGLSYKCNDNVDNIKDFYVEVDPGSQGVDNGIAYFQGAPNIEANNTFSLNSLPFTFQHFFIALGAEPSDYYYGAGLNETPIDRNSQVSAIPVNLNATADCADDDGGIGPSDPLEEGKSGDESYLSQTLEDYRDLMDDFYALLDGGDTDELLLTIETTQSESELYIILSDISPYLSHTVYVSVVESGLMASEHLESLLSLNPALTNSNKVISALETTEGTGYSQEWLTETASLIAEDPRMALEADLHLLGMELMDQNKTAIHAVYRDTLGYSLEGLNENRMHLLDPVQYYSAVFARFDQGQEEAWTMLENLPNEFRLSTAQEEEWITMQQYLAFLDNLKQNEREINRLTEGEIAELMDISETPNGGSAAGWASNALCFHYGICKPATAIEAPELIVEASPKANTTEQLEDLKETSFRIVPNPTSNEARLISIDAQAQTRSLSVFDINGRRILFRSGANHRQFDTSGLPNGIYFCRVVTLTNQVENLKFIVNH